MDPEPGDTNPAQDATDFVLDSIDYMLQLMLTNYQESPCNSDDLASPAKP